MTERWLPVPKKVEFLVQMQGDKNFFSIFKNHYYYLLLNEDDDTWEVGIHHAQSLWGHKPPATGPLRPSILRPV